MIELAHEHMHHGAFMPAAGMGLGALLAALFSAGLAGGFTHCAGMCGPFVLAQVAGFLDKVDAARMSELTRLRGAALLPYHLGRLTTYSALGALAGALAGRVEQIAGLRLLAAALLALASLLFLAQAAGRIALPGAGGPGAKVIAGLRGSAVGGPAGRLVARFGEALARLARPWMEADQRSGPGRSAARRYGLGVVLGFLPCGLLYGALAGAAAAGGAAAGALAMAAFTLGTFPGLATVGLVGHMFLRGRASRAVSLAGGLLFLVNAAVLAYLAFRAVP
jgi:sulfite exporter TauE/SafE